MRYTELTEQTDPKVECLHLLKPAYHPQRSRDQRKLTRIHHNEAHSPRQKLTICNLYSPPNKAINLQILQPNSEDWMIVGDFNSHSPSWGYPSLDAKGEEVKHWIVSNRLVLINTPTDPPNLLFKSVENNQHTGYCHSYRQHPEDC